MFQIGTWVKSSGVAPERYQGMIGRVVESNTGEFMFMNRGKLGYYVMVLERRKFLVRGLLATWIEETTEPEGDDLLPWMLEIMKR